MKAFAQLPPLAERKNGAAATAPVRVQRVCAPAVPEDYDAHLHQLVDRATRSIKAKPAIDFGYGDLIAAAREGGHSARAPAADESQELPRRQAEGGPRTKDVHSIHETARFGVSSSPEPLPHADAIQRSFGRYNVTDVVAHTGAPAKSAAMALGASAFATGNHVVFASTPTLHTAAHEAAHVIQQRGGLQLAGGVGQVGDPHERHADAVADAVVEARSSEALLDMYAGPGSSRASEPRGNQGAAQRKIIQRAAQTSNWGRFIDTAYTPTPNGVSMLLNFEPGAGIDASKIGLTQSVRTILGGNVSITDPSQESRLVGGTGPGAGSRIDRISTQDNPIYGSSSVGAGHGLADTAQTNAPVGVTPNSINATYELGYRYTDATGPHTKNAWLFDTPTGAGMPSSSMTFETTALALSGAQAGSYYGSVRWGWERDAAGSLTQIPFALVSQGVPSAGFLAAASAWNSSTLRGTVVARNAPTSVYGSPGGAAVFTIDQNTPVTVGDAYGSGGLAYRMVTIRGSGAHAGASGYIKVSDLRDQGDGAATVDLPTPDVRIVTTAQQFNQGVPGPVAETRAVPIGTRVVVTGEHWGLPPPTKTDVRVVDGPLTGAEGYVDAAALRSER